MPTQSVCIDRFDFYCLDLLKTEGVKVVDSPRKNQIKETDSDYIKLAKKGGHSGMDKLKFSGIYFKYMLYLNHKRQIKV